MTTDTPSTQSLCHECKKPLKPDEEGICNTCLDEKIDYGEPDYKVEACFNCGKDIYDWSDYGCEYCDARVRAFQHIEGTNDH